MANSLLIGVPTLNGSERVFSLLRSFESFPPNISYEMLIVDDGSDSRESDFIQEVCESFDADLVRHVDKKDRPENRGVPAAWNTIRSHTIEHGFTHTIILNDDIQILPGAIDSAYYVLSNNSGLGVVGIPPFHKQPSGMRRHGPEEIDPGIPWRCRVPPGCSFGVSIDTFHDVGEFDENFKAHFEDVDYALRCAQAQKVNVTIPQGVLHDWSATFKSNPKMKGHLRLELSRRLFKKKWGATPEYLFAQCPCDRVRLNYLDLSGNPTQSIIPYSAQ